MTRDGDPCVIATTARVVIRPWRSDESDRLFDLLSRMEVVKWLSQPPRPMKHNDEAVARIERWSAELAADPRFGAWAAVERSSGVPAGTVLLKPLPDGDGEVEIGWHFHPDSWGKGLASEAAAALLARGFDDGLEEVWAVTDLDNHPSSAVCRRIGMRLLGVTHRWYHEPSLMFWTGARPDRDPSLNPDEPVRIKLYEPSGHRGPRATFRDGGVISPRRAPVRFSSTAARNNPPS
jgi:RimJ/RimL family protein N-acetyltransferase